jgi:hypothetical protein
MIRASAIGIIGMLVTIAGCVPLWSPVPDWLSPHPDVEGSSLQEQELPTPPVKSPVNREGQPGGSVPPLYAAMFTPVPATEGKEINSPSEPATSSPDSDESPTAPATPTPRSTSLPPATSTSTPVPASTPISVLSPRPTSTPAPTATSTPTPQPVQPSPAGAPTLLLLSERQSIGAGEEIEIELVLSEASKGLSGFDIILSLRNEAAAELTGGEMPDFGLTSVTGMPGDSAHLRAVDLSSLVASGSSNVLLATLRLKGESAGVAGLAISINALDDDSGKRITPDIPEVSIRVQ